MYEKGKEVPFKPDPLEEKRIRSKLTAVAQGREKGELVFRGGQVLNVFTEELLKGDVVVSGGRIACVTADSKPHIGEATSVLDVTGLTLTPGLIDPHVHIESSALTPTRFAETIVPHGVTTIFFDPHEIANVEGLSGVRWMADELKDTPIKGFLTVPSCVPASAPRLETTGETFGLEEIKEALAWPGTAALGEMMNFPGLLQGDEETLEKILETRKASLPVEGHGSGLSGDRLRAYAAAGIESDHEAVSKSEATERARAGMWTYAREGSAWADLSEVIKALTEEDLPPHRFCLATDDREAADLLEEGSIDQAVRKAIEGGLSPARAVRLATLNPAIRFRIEDRLGSLGPGRFADLVLVSDLEEFKIEGVFIDGQRWEEYDWRIPGEEGPRKTVNLPGRVEPEDLIPRGRETSFALGLHAGTILTDKEEIEGELEATELPPDFLACAVLERHKGTGNIGRGLLHGFGLEGGAVASSVAHDSHNLIVAGKDYGDMALAVNRLAKIGGGQILVSDGEIRAEVRLPVGGLMSPLPGKEVAEEIEDLKRELKELGTKLEQPLMILSSLALPVIPALRITDKGLVDVEKFELLS